MIFIIEYQCITYSWELTKSEITTSKPAWTDPGPLHICERGRREKKKQKRLLGFLAGVAYVLTGGACFPVLLSCCVPSGCLLVLEARIMG